MLTTIPADQLATATGGGGLFDPFAIIAIPLMLQSWGGSPSHSSPPPAPVAPQRAAGKPLDIRPAAQRDR